MPTIKDVAKEAGVSVGTVSKVINNLPVKPKTKELVEEAIEKLKYEPNIYARGFKINRTNTVAVILPTIWNPFFSELAYNLEKSLRNAGMKMILCNSEEDIKNEIEFISMAKQNKMDGIIAITYSDIDKYVSEDIPFISIDRYFSKDITYISSDNYAGGRIAAEKLIESGCRNLAYIGRGSKINNATRKRKEGFMEYCIEKNIPYKICEVLAPIDEYENMLDKFIDENLKDELMVDGVFAVTDDQALQFIEKVNKLGIDVPKDVQVVGFDGRRSSKNESIKISTIRQPLELLAEESVKELLNIIENNEARKKIILPVSYVKGYTTNK